MVIGVQDVPTSSQPTPTDAGSSLAALLRGDATAQPLPKPSPDSLPSVPLSLRSIKDGMSGSTSSLKAETELDLDAVLHAESLASSAREPASASTVASGSKPGVSATVAKSHGATQASRGPRQNFGSLREALLALQNDVVLNSTSATSMPSVSPAGLQSSDARRHPQQGSVAMSAFTARIQHALRNARTDHVQRLSERMRRQEQHEKERERAREHARQHRNAELLAQDLAVKERRFSAQQASSSHKSGRDATPNVDDLLGVFPGGTGLDLSGALRPAGLPDPFLALSLDSRRAEEAALDARYVCSCAWVTMFPCRSCVSLCIM